MRIGLVADPCDPKKPGGLGRYVYELVRALLAADTENAFIIFTKTPLPGISAEQRPLPRNVWLVGASALDPSLDLHIFFTPVIPLFFRPRRSIVIAQDFAYLELPSGSLRARAYSLVSYFMHRRSLRLADMVVGISEATRQSAITHFALTPAKTAAIPIAAMPYPEPVAVPGLPEKFFLFAGVLKERKNVANIIRAFAFFVKGDRGGHQLLIAGKKSGEYYHALERLVHELGIEERVRFLGYVSDSELAYLYTRAEALVFASLVEGFGMPVLEAFAAGLPVITSKEGALAEVASDAALLVDPHDPSAIAEAMRRMAGESALRALLIEKGRARAHEFSWERAAADLLSAIRSLKG